MDRLAFSYGAKMTTHTLDGTCVCVCGFCIRMFDVHLNICILCTRNIMIAMNNIFIDL